MARNVLIEVIDIERATSALAKKLTIFDTTPPGQQLTNTIPVIIILSYSLKK